MYTLSGTKKLDILQGLSHLPWENDCNTLLPLLPWRKFDYWEYIYQQNFSPSKEYYVQFITKFSKYPQGHLDLHVLRMENLIYYTKNSSLPDRKMINLLEDLFFHFSSILAPQISLRNPHFRMDLVIRGRGMSKTNTNKSICSALLNRIGCTIHRWKGFAVQ